MGFPFGSDGNAGELGKQENKIRIRGAEKYTPPEYTKNN